MSVQLLDKTRKINKLLHNNNSSKVVFNDICDVLKDILNSNILVISKKGKVLGTGLTDGVEEIRELIVDEVGGFIDPLLNERLLGILSTKENVNLETLGFVNDIKKYTAIITPIDIAGERLGTLFVYRENDPYDIDDIIGILHLKDAMKEMMFENHAEETVGRIPNLIRDASYIPETRSINDLFKRMQAKKLHMAIVVDEYGQTSGIVTMEDILEEIVGNILDEYDEDDHFIIEQLDNTYLMKGLTPLEDVEETLSIDLQEEEYETLNGYLTSLLGHIPNIDEDKEIRANGYLFTILAVENNTIQRVRVEKLPEEKGEEKCQDIQNSQT